MEIFSRCCERLQIQNLSSIVQSSEHSVMLVISLENSKLKQNPGRDYFMIFDITDPSSQKRSHSAFFSSEFDPDYKFKKGDIILGLFQVYFKLFTKSLTNDKLETDMTKRQ
jgi:hypothetical protein